jgi:hypothetical protein
VKVGIPETIPETGFEEIAYRRAPLGQGIKTWALKITSTRRVEPVIPLKSSLTTVSM